MGFLFSQGFLVHMDLLWKSLAQPGLVTEDSLGTVPWRSTKRKILGFHWKEGSVPLLKISLRWICANALQMQPCPALLNLTLQSQAGSENEHWCAGCFHMRREISFSRNK